MSYLFTGVLQSKLEAYDPEGDFVVFLLDHTKPKPLLGEAEISDDGTFYYRPEEDACGTDYVHIILTELRNDGIPPNSSLATIQIIINEVNYNPNIMFLYQDEDLARHVNRVNTSVTVRKAKVFCIFSLN